jgi:hypothetical protein
MLASVLRALVHAAGYAGETLIPGLNQSVKLYGELRGGEITSELPR